MSEEGIVTLLLVKDSMKGEFRGEDACGNDAKIERGVLGEEIVEIVSLVSAMKVAETKMEDAWSKLGAIVGWNLKRWWEGGEGVTAETEWGHEMTEVPL